MKFLITGGTGFIGSHVVMNLVKNGHEIIVLARNPHKIPALKNIPAVKVVQWQIGQDLLPALKNQQPETLIHIALGWGDDAQSMLLNDTLGSVKLFEQAVSLGVQRIIYTSSTAAAGEMTSLMNESMITRPVDLYGSTKAATENFLFGFCHSLDVSCSVIRPGYTFGNPALEGAPVQPDNRFRNIVTYSMNNQDIEVVQNDGTQFIDAEKIAELYRLVALDSCDREIFYALGKEFVSWEYVAKRAVEIFGSKSNIVVIDKGYGRKPFIFNVSKAKERFGFSSDGLRTIDRHIEYYGSR